MEAVGSTVQIKLNSPEQLLNSFDPSPFRDRDLDDRAASYTPPSPRGWLRVIDTARASPDDALEPEAERPIEADSVTVAPRSVVVLIRPRRETSSVTKSL